jgi:tRNA modification GTPase
MTRDDTIVAVSTPPGRGAIGIVRLSGERAVEIATGLLPVPSPLETQRATLQEFRDPASGRLLDQVVVTCFRRPHSYTGEDVVELACHGAPVILARLVECAMECGARAAEPGEFTLRAFLNGRIDLTQAEAIRDLIESRTLYQAHVAAEQMEGAVSRRLAPHKKSLLDLVARLEAGIDFAEDDVPVSGWQEIITAIDAIRADLARLVEGYAYGRIVREGLSLAIVGRPNVGKSSLFNRLLNEDRAIVTATPGTTRDLVSESAAIEGIPLRFVDTAGIRETTDEVEALGVKKSFEALADSDLRLLVVDAAEGWTAEDAKLLARLRPLGALLIAANKSDLQHQLTPVELDRVSSASSHASAVIEAGSTSSAASASATDPLSFAGHEVVARPQAVWTSALTGDGLAELRGKILEIAAPAHGLAPDSQFITNLRHQQLIQQSLEALARARAAAVEKVQHEMLLLDLYDALHALDALTGSTAVEDVLGVIFSTFCVGK